MGNITATRDLAIIGILAYAAYKLQAPYKKAEEVIAAVGEKVTEKYYFYSAGGELKAAADAAQVGQTDTELTQDIHQMLVDLNKQMGGTGEGVPTPEIRKELDAGEVLQGTVEVLPLPPSDTSPELTPEIERMLRAPHGGIPSGDPLPGQFDIMPITPPQPRQPTYRTIQPIVQPIVPSVTELVRQPSPPARQPITETKPLASMSREQAASEGYKYSGAVGWYK